jgi:methoxymalonate biosynthesis acyl carrier protein
MVAKMGAGFTTIRRGIVSLFMQGNLCLAVLKRVYERITAMKDVKKEVRAFLARFFHDLELGDDEDFFELGFVNSLFAMQLVMFIESEFDLHIEDDELDIANFLSLNAIANLVERKKLAV